MSSTAATSPANAAHRRRFTVDALFTDTRPQAAGVDDMPAAKLIRLDRIVPDPSQPRRIFNDRRMEELAASIALEGVLQPIVVRYDEQDDIYVIVNGERRWRASRKAGLTMIPAVIREVPEGHLLVQQLMENIVREDLSAIDRAAALRSLKNQLDDAPWEQVADTVGIKRSRLFQLLGTEKLPLAIQDDIRAGRLSEKQSRALQGLSEAKQLAMRDAILADGLSFDRAMNLAREIRSDDVPDDTAVAALKLSELTSTPKTEGCERDDPVELLGLIEKAAAGDPDSSNALVKATKSAMAAPFDHERLRIQIHGLARTLSRLDAGQLHTDPDSVHLLESLTRAVQAKLKAAS